MPELAGASDLQQTGLSCKRCHLHIASRNDLLSYAFHGYCGKAALFAGATNVAFKSPSILLMYTGVHTIQEVECKSCAAGLGWKIIRAHEDAEKWKEGRCLLELTLLEDTPETHSSVSDPSRPVTPASRAAYSWDNSHKRSSSEPRSPASGLRTPRTSMDNGAAPQVVPQASPQKVKSSLTPLTSSTNLMSPSMRPMGPRSLSRSSSPVPPQDARSRTLSVY